MLAVSGIPQIAQFLCLSRSCFFSGRSLVFQSKQVAYIEKTIKTKRVMGELEELMRHFFGKIIDRLDC